MADSTHNGHRKRLRERIQKNGFASLFPHELLEYILFGCMPQGDTNALAHKLLAAFGSLDKVFNATFKELTQIDGIGEAAATLISSYGFVAKELAKGTDAKAVRLNTLGKIREYLNAFFEAKTREEFHVLLLDGDFNLTRHIVMASPIVNKVYVDMDEVMESVANLKPAAIVFAHNHPSGNPEPSAQDVDFTSRYFTALSLAFNVSVAEHMIFGKNGSCYSFRNGGELERIKRSIESANNIRISDSSDLGGFNE